MERLDRVRDRVVRSVVTEPARPRDVSVVPGLGALGYLTRLSAALVEHGAEVAVLDLPGFGTGRPLASPPTVEAVAAARADWLQATTPPGSVVLLGHSTGAQAALRAVAHHPVAVDRLVLAGPTFPPQHRRMASVLGRGIWALRRDPPSELGILRDHLCGGRAVWTLLRSALADEPERTVRSVTVDLVVTAGGADALAPDDWLTRLADEAAGAAAVVRLPGSHNNAWTHPRELARAVLGRHPPQFGRAMV